MIDLGPSSKLEFPNPDLVSIDEEIVNVSNNLSAEVPYVDMKQIEENIKSGKHRDNKVFNLHLKVTHNPKF